MLGVRGCLILGVRWIGSTPPAREGVEAQVVVAFLHSFHPVRHPSAFWAFAGSVLFTYHPPLLLAAGFQLAQIVAE